MSINMINSLISVNKLTNVNFKQEKTSQKLSTGLRINAASDDAAALAVSMKMRTQISGFNSAQRNIQDGISLLQTAEGALDEIHGMLSRAYELSVQSSNGIYTVDEQTMLSSEARQLKFSIEEIVNQTSFNGIPLLQGDEVTIQTGINVDDTMTIETPVLSHLVRHLIIKGVPDKITDPENIATMINEVSTTRATLGAVQNRLEHTLTTTINTNENLTAAESHIRDTDFAKELAVQSKNSVLSTVIADVLNKNMNSNSILKLLDS